MEPSKNALILSGFGVHEQLYLKFMYHSVMRKIDKTPSLIFIKASAEKQEAFEEFVKKNYKNHPITDVNFAIRKTLSNVWNAIKEISESALNENELRIEKKCQSIAFRECFKKGQFGKVLTVRQAKIFTICAKTVDIPFSKGLKASSPTLLTVDEKLYLNFIAPLVRNSLDDKCTLIFLDTAIKTQIDFISYAKERKKTYSRINLNLLRTINSLTDKAIVELRKTIDPMDINHEVRRQRKADEALSVHP